MKQPDNIILERTSQLFVEQGVKSVSMGDIAKYCGCSKKELYALYASKEELVDQTFEHDLEKNKFFIEHLADKCENAILEIFDMHNFFLERFANINPVVFFDLTKYYHQLFREKNEKRKKICTTFLERNLERGIKEGLYREDLDKEVVSRLWFSKIELMQGHELFPLEQFSFRYILLKFSELHVRSIATQKGTEILNNYLLTQKNDL